MLLKDTAVGVPAAKTALSTKAIRQKTVVRPNNLKKSFINDFMSIFSTEQIKFILLLTALSYHLLTALINI
jgi:hypothetical protein